MVIGCLFCHGVFNNQKLLNEHLIQFIPELLPVSGLTTTLTDDYHEINIMREALRANWTDEGGLLNPAPEDPARRAVLAEFAKHVGQELGKGKGKEKGRGKPGVHGLGGQVAAVIDNATHQPHASASDRISEVCTSHNTGTDDTETGIPVTHDTPPQNPTGSALFVLKVSFPNRVMIPIDIHSNTTLAEAVTAAVVHEQSMFHASSSDLAQGASRGFLFVGNHGLCMNDVEWLKLKRSVESKEYKGNHVITVRLKRAQRSRMM